MGDKKIAEQDGIKTPVRFRDAGRHRIDIGTLLDSTEATASSGMAAIDVRDRVPPAPTGLERVKWLGPGLLWMLSSVGAGSVLFTPRIGSRYQYELL